MKKDRGQILGFIGVILFIALVTILVMTSVQNSTRRAQIPVEERTTAHELAIFQAGNYVEEDSKTVQELEKSLDNLANSTINSKEEIGDFTTDAIIELKRDYDIEIKLTKFLEEAEKIAKESGPNSDYKEISAKVVIILSQEKSET
ncbi:MAG: hypothetical protein ACOC6I_03075 [Candidatus Bipolaricaulota bacterium]